jgi:hypothetical protein
MRPLLIAVVLSGCSEYRFGRVELDSDPAEEPDAPRSPWDDLDPGQLPEDVFVVAFHDTTGLVGEPDGWGTWCLPADVSPHLWMPPVRYALVDVRGRVLDEIAAPFPESPRYDAFEDLAATPDGRVLVTSQAADDAGFARRTWTADLRTGEVREVLFRLNWQSSTGVTFLGNPVELGVVFAEVRPALDPVDPNALWVLRDAPWQPESLAEPALWRFRFNDPSAAPDVWTLADLAPDALGTGEDVQLALRSLAAVEESGRTLLVVDAGAHGAAVHPDGADGWQWLTLVFDPETRTHPWVFDRTVAGAETHDPGLFAGDGEGHGRLLFEESLLTDLVAPTDFQVFTPGEAAVDVAAEDLRCNTPLALLDGEAPTFVWAGHPDRDDGSFGERVVFSHRGADVLAWDVLQDGLNDVPFDARAFAWVR